MELDYEKLSQAYREDGMITLGPALDDAELEEAREQVGRYMNRVVPRLPEAVRGKLVRFESDGATVRSCYSMHVVDDYFSSFANREDLKGVIREIAGWEPEVYCVETFNKAARVGSSVPMHQEVAFHLPDTTERAHLWFALDDVSADNGPVRFWLGSQQRLLPHAPDPNGYLTCDEGEATALSREIHTSIVPAGWATMHDGLVAHDSLPNESEDSRLGLLCGYSRAA